MAFVPLLFRRQGRAVKAKRCAAEIYLAGKVFLPHMFLPSVSDARETGAEIAGLSSRRMTLNRPFEPLTRGPFPAPHAGLEDHGYRGGLPSRVRRKTGERGTDFDNKSPLPRI